MKSTLVVSKVKKVLQFFMKSFINSFKLFGESLENSLSLQNSESFVFFLFARIIINFKQKDISIGRSLKHIFVFTQKMHFLASYTHYLDYTLKLSSLPIFLGFTALQDLLYLWFFAHLEISLHQELVEIHLSFQLSFVSFVVVCVLRHTLLMHKSIQL